MRKLLTIMPILLLFSCSVKTDCQKEELVQVTDEHLDSISDNWKKDSMGCLNLRDYTQIKLLIEQRRLIGKDSLLVKQYLGQPNGKTSQGGGINFVYFLECGSTGKISHYNFYCRFNGGILESYSGAVF